MTGDGERFFRKFWEVSDIGGKWDFVQGANNSNFLFSGFSSIVCWENGRGQLHVYAAENRHKLHDMHESGNRAWGKSGIIINQQGDLKATPYYGAKIDGSASVIIPKERSAVHAIWNFLSSKQYHDDVRKIDKKRNVTNANLLKVPFSDSKMHEVTTGAMPEPLSSFPSEWIFHGHPAHADVGVALQTALSRLCGCRWPAETDPDMRLSDEARAWVVKASELPPGDNDGLLGVPAVAGEKPLADRLRAYLSAAFGAEWSDALERRLVAKADETLDKKTSRETSLEFWVRDRAFRQHCALFGQRPFLWHISDGSKDGFSVFVRYHHFDQANLRKLTYTLLGDWLARAKAENNALRYEKGRELQQKLEKILEGEKPYDIFVRWKSLAQQPLGWDPDLDDGVRQNIRPFIMAGVLTRDLSKTLKGKDRGKDVASAPWYDVFNGERRNDHHTTLAEKRAAREAAAKPVEAAK